MASSVSFTCLESFLFGEERMEMMKEIILALLAGIIVGLIFKFLRLPLPAPPVLAGIMGIAGIYVGGIVADKIIKLFS